MKNHEKEDSVWLIYYKKNAPKSNLNWSEAVDQALCFGWIDSTAKTVDEERYMQYFCKRKPKSNWSKINKDKVKVLIEQGLMAEAGLRSIEVAKENGSWTYLDAVEALEVPEDLQSELNSFQGAPEFFDDLSDSVKKLILYWVHSAKREDTRKKRILEVAESASQGQKPKHLR